MVHATACANIALIKYWGKADAALNTPAAGSLSLTLDALRTFTRVELLPPEAAEDQLEIDGRIETGKARARIERFFDLVRAMSGRPDRVRVISENRFPTAAGLASSASAFAALAVAGARAFDLELEPSALSVLARRGSGSAARSIFGGLVRMHARGERGPEDAHAEPFTGARIELGAVIVAAKAGAKKIGSTEGMERTRTTSPYHAAWLETVERDLQLAEAALGSGDVEALAQVVEGNCLAMHADAMAARPGIIYFEAPTLWAIERVRSLRAAGTPVFFTVDAGPHLVAFAPPEVLERVAEALRGHEGVAQVMVSRAGEGARILEEGA